MNFLEQVAQELYSLYGTRISELTLVFPSRRAQLYFADYLSAIIEVPLWQPATASIDDIFGSITGLRTTHHYKLVTELYKAYRQHHATSESFDQFFFWGEIMLADFDSMDKYLADADSLLQNLEAIKDLDQQFAFLSEEQLALIHSFWSHVSPSHQSEIQNNFIALWSALLPTYKDFKTRLRTQGVAYQGMLYAEGAQHLQQEGFDFGSNHYVFIGFNALNKCEQVLLEYLKKVGKATYFWDYDAYYINNMQQEAGLFMRRNLEAFPPPEWDQDYSPFDTPKDIQIVATPSEVLQAKLLPTMLNEVRGQQPMSQLDRRTAVVLANEGLLIPTMYAVPAEVEAINITMGFPLSQTPVYSLCEMLIRLHKNARTTKENTPPKLYHKDVQALLNHQYVKSLSGEAASTLQQYIVDHNLVYLEQHDIDPLADTLLKSLLSHRSKPQEFSRQLSEIFRIISNKESNEASADSQLRNQYIACAYQELNKLNDALDEGGLELGMTTYLSLLRNTLRGVKIPFEGEPIAGLQIMGILETRTLDFDNLVILSLNDDIFPRSENTPSLIPYSLRKAFGLPTIEQHEAMYAYYFYRLLQRAQRVRLLYNSQASESQTGEMSRYLRQLVMESPHQVPERQMAYSISLPQAKPISVLKDPTVQAALAQFTDGGTKALSPTALAAFLDCPLRFYFAQIAELREPEQVTEEVDEAMLGNIFHKTMEYIYQPMQGRVVTQAVLEQLIANKAQIDTMVLEACALEFFFDKSKTQQVEHNGRLLLAKETIARYVSNCLRYDLTQAPFEVLELEHKITGSIAITVNEQVLNVNLKGILDRVDRTAEGIRIIDYKTGGGGDEKSKLHEVANLFSPERKLRKKEILQMLLYALMTHKRYPTLGVNPHLYYIRNMYSTGFDSALQIKEGTKYVALGNAVPLLDTVSVLLSELLQQLFDTHSAFVQTADLDNCTLCPYKNICHR